MTKDIESEIQKAEYIIFSIENTKFFVDDTHRTFFGKYRVTIGECGNLLFQNHYD